MIVFLREMRPKSICLNSRVIPGGGPESGTDADAAQVVDARLLGEGLCTGIERC